MRHKVMAMEFRSGIDPGAGSEVMKLVRHVFDPAGSAVVMSAVARQKAVDIGLGEHVHGGVTLDAELWVEAPGGRRFRVRVRVEEYYPNPCEGVDLAAESRVIG